MYQSFDFDFAAPVNGAEIPAPWIAAAPATSSLFGFDIVDAGRADIATLLVERARYRLPTRVAFLNAHCVNVAAVDRQYRQSLEESDFVLPDGSGLRIASKLAGRSFGDNLNGTDLFPLLCEKAAHRGVSIYLLGGMDGVARAAALAMADRFPGLQIVGTHHGYFGDEDEGRIIEEINASGAGMVFIGLGVPRQDRWIAQNADRIEASVLLGVGGLFDYYSNRIPRAPAAFRDLGCEWVWRLAQEPRRLANRYLVGNVAFMVRALSYALVARGAFGAVKRAGDFVASALGILALAPVLLAIVLLIRLEDGGPALFRQVRIGKNGRPFTLFKFRSMVVDAERQRGSLESSSDRDSVCFKLRRDPRVTRVGTWLRRLSLDELPQLFNVLRGEMSIVGPRPALPQEVLAYWPGAMRRLDVKPGITCTWQVSGRAEIPFEKQVEMDIDYVRRPSLLRDVALLFRTVPAVVTARGAY
ncbi:UDP-phosphate galactose phosphotransferase [Novosphingobium sp. PC22D]|uniref:WecB/TagA/CpsF family glycosyltransferase n=1 Tax=Novosphingobium sp. PC22D TaxID=1962403 RepID=UPI000BEF8648|nr:WecB/TagA/CpsF family glycosyltransferase [Novosphingobium sp. PC22D]PEQ10498.1 UDP-phosphate galactose phosphotransferase [Novosphingobium sp. PC22D]